MSHTKHLRQLLQTDNLAQFLTEMLEATEQNGQKDLHSDITLQSASYHGNERQKRSNIISDSFYAQTRARIRYALESYLEEYKDNGLYVFDDNDSKSINNQSLNPVIMNNKKSVLVAFAANNLSGVKTETDKIWDSVFGNNMVTATRIENATIPTLVNGIIDSKDLFMFHFGGHSDQEKIVLDGLRTLDKIRLSRILLPDENHKLQIIFLNGCLSYGHVGILTAKGVKAIIATNVKVNDIEAANIGAYFYKLFFERNYTLKAAFETAEATISGRNAFPTIVNPGEIDENQPMPSAWTLFINAQYTEILNWKLADFVGNSSGNAVENINTTENPNTLRYLSLIDINIDKAFEELDKIFLHKNATYGDLNDEYINRPNNFSLADFRGKFKRFVITHLK